MADGAEIDPRVVSFREHTATKEEIIARVAKVELEQAEMKASLMHLPSKFDDFAQEMRTRLDRIASAQSAPAHAPQVDHFSLAVQRLLDTVKPREAHPILLTLAIVGALALGALSMFALLKVA